MSMERKIKTKPRTEEKDPELAGQAMAAFAETGSKRKTALALGISRHTVTAIVERNPEDFATIKKMRAAQHFRIADKCLKQLDETDLSKVSPMQLSIMSGIHTQRGLDCIANEVPMPYDPQLARRCIEESEFWRKQVQELKESKPVKEEPALSPVEAGHAPNESQTADGAQDKPC